MSLRNIIKTATLAILFCAACQPNILPDSRPSKVVDAEGETRTITFTADNRWSIYTSFDWINVNPSGGVAGENTVTLKFSPNSTMEERSGAIYVLDGARTLMYRFTQNSLDLISTDHSEYYVPEEGSFTVLVRSSLDYNINCPTEWIKCPSKTHISGSSEETAIEFGLENNSSKDSREGSISFLAEGGLSVTVKVIQAGHVEIDWNRDFYRRALGYRFTGDWCGYCPNLAYDISRYETERPSRFNCISFYDASSDTRLRFAGSGKYETKFNVSGKPTLVVDRRGAATSLSSPGYRDVIRGMVDEGLESYKSTTAITASLSVTDGRIEVHPTVWFKEAGEYHIHAVLLESGVVVPQSDYTGLYNDLQLKNFAHNNVVRSYMTPLVTGETYNASAQSKKLFNYGIDVPANVVDKRRLSVAIYVTKPATNGPQAVEKVSYYKAMNEYVDNSVIVASGQSVGLKYE